MKKIITAMLLILCFILQIGCSGSTGNNPTNILQTTSKNVEQFPGGADGRESVEVKLLIGRDKQWIFDEITNLMSQKNILVNGKNIKITTDQAGSGEAMEKLLRGDALYLGWMPASSIYLPMANERWYAKGQTKPIVSEEATTVFLTPMVIAMKESLAAKMGYPVKAIGWSDILSLSTSEDGWGIHGALELNPVKFAHTHPAKSNSGLSTLIAAEYAFSAKTKGLTLDDVKANSQKLKQLEKTIVHYGDSTSLLQKKIVDMGPKFIQYATLYEYMVADMNSKGSGGEKTVAIYPKEGTIWGDVTFTEVNNKATEEQQQALKEIKALLLSDEIQTMGMEKYFFRPAKTSIQLSSAISKQNGVDPAEPKTTLEIPSQQVINAILEDWSLNMKKRANVTFVLDLSGSMRGEPLANMKKAMNSIMTTDNRSKDYINMDSEDYISVSCFNSELYNPITVKGDQLVQLNESVNQLEAKGGTRLYDAIYAALDSNKQMAEKIGDKRINIVVVLTDGQDTNSRTEYEKLVSYIEEAQGEIPVILTIGYGDVDEKVLTEIAEKSGGKYYAGNPETIETLMKDIKTFF